MQSFGTLWHAGVGMLPRLPHGAFGRGETCQHSDISSAPRAADAGPGTALDGPGGGDRHD